MGFGTQRLTSVARVAGAFALLLTWLPTLAHAGDCADTRVDLRGDWGQARFTVELADDPGERAQGLMYREHLSAGQGMIFLYPAPQLLAFWMKNTLVALDMLFISAEGRVVKIHENAIPGDLTPIEGGEPVQAVLEIKGGLSRAIGITTGSALRYPGLDQSIALWPCGAGD